MTVEVFINASLPRFEQVVELDSQQYLLGFDWNERTSSWSINVSETDATAIISGTRLVADWDSFQHRQSDDLFPGRLVLIDTTGEGGDPTRTGLGKDYKMFYTPEVEL